MNPGDSRWSRWLARAGAGAVVFAVLAATTVLAPMARTLGRDALLRLASTASPTPRHQARLVTAHRVATPHPPALVTGPLDGEPTPRANALRRPIAVMIDNYFPDARPQTGLGDASVVFETMVEGGFTRLMALYLEHDPTVVGPVRSTRIYFDDWAAAYHAILIHVGGNDDAAVQLWQMRPVYNLDEGNAMFSQSYTNPYFWRSADRSVPDNMYANVVKLRTYAASQGQDWHYSNASLPHKQPDLPARRGGPGTLTITFVDPLYPFVPANPDYRVQYRYDPTSDSYLRIVGNATQIDTATHRPIHAQNIVVMQTGAGTPDLAAGTTVDAVTIPVIGSGPAAYFRDGRVEHGAWRQKDELAPLQFFDRRGTPMQFNPGQTWIEVLPVYSTATWSSR